MTPVTMLDYNPGPRVDPATEELQRLIARFAGELDDPALVPNPKNDLAAHTERLERLAKEFETTLLPAAEAAGDPELGVDVVYIGTELAVLLRLVGAELSATKTFGLVDGMRPPSPLDAEVRGARVDTQSYAAIMEARWIQRTGIGDVSKPLRRVKTENEALKELARAIRETPRPISGAPGLFTFNGFGLMMWGNRDQQHDGTYVATHCLVFLFLPVLPIASYVVQQVDGGYRFFAKVPLSGFARWYRRLLGIGMVLGVLALVASSWWNAAPRRLAREVDALEAQGLQGDAEVSAYDAVITRWVEEEGAPDALDAPVDHLFELLIADVERPFDADGVPKAERLVARLERLPANVRPSATAHLESTLGALAAEVGDETLAEVDAARQLLQLATRVRADPTGAREQQVRELAFRAADLVAQQWPLHAIERYATLSDAQARSAATRLAEEVEDPAALEQIAPAIEALGLEVLKRRLDAVRADSERSTILASLAAGEDVDVEAALVAHPGDQALIAAASDRLRARGELEQAKALWGEVTLGDLHDGALFAYAALERGRGEREAAAAIYEQLVSERLATFRRIASDADARAATLYDSLATQANLGQLPALEASLRGASQERAQQIFDEYARSEIRRDPTIVELNARLTRLAPVVGAALALGQMELERAQELDGDERRSALERAQSHFLSVATQAEGSPDYHLGLGETYHRLGRVEDGDRELASVAASGEASMLLAVAHTYRGLQESDTAREYATRGHAVAEGELKDSAAILLSLLAETLEEEERWLRGASPAVASTRLMEVQARRARREGRFADADRHFAAAEEAWLEADSPNNAALSAQGRYSVTGDPRHSARAVRLLEQAQGRQPDDPIVLTNVGHATITDAWHRVLGRALHMRALRPPFGSESYFVAVLDDARREALYDRLHADAGFQRGLDQMQRASVLAPRATHLYDERIAWLRRRHDVDGLRQLWTSLRSRSFEGSAGARVHRELLEGGGADEQLAQMRRQVAVLRADLERVDRDGHPTTRAALRGYLASQRAWLATLEQDVEALHEAEALVREARRLDPRLRLDRQLARVLLDRAISEHAATDAALGAAWSTASRELSVTQFLYQNREHGAAVADHPAIVEAVEIVAGQEPWIDGWMLGEALDDPGLQAAHVSARDDEEAALAIRIEAHLAPWRRGLAIERDAYR